MFLIVKITLVEHKMIECCILFGKLTINNCPSILMESIHYKLAGEFILYRFETNTFLYQLVVFLLSIQKLNFHGNLLLYIFKVYVYLI